MRRGRPRVLKVSWTLESAQTSSADSGKLAIRLQALDRKLNVPGTPALSGNLGQTRRRPRVLKDFLALWNRPNLVLHTLGKLAIRLQALERKLNARGSLELSALCQTRRMRRGTKEF